MDKKRMLKGFMRLMFALIITCGVGFFTMGKDVKADDTDGSVSFVSDSAGGITFTVTDPSGGKAVEKLEVFIDGKSIATYDSLTTGMAPFTFTAANVISSINDTNKFTGTKTFSAKYSLAGESSISRNATATGSPATLAVSVFKKPASVEHASLSFSASDADKSKELTDGIYAYNGVVITYTATPDGGYYVSGWSNDSTYPNTPDTGSDNKIVKVTVDAEKGGATFTPAISKNPPAIQDYDFSPSDTEFSVGSPFTVEFIVKDSSGNIINTGYSIKWTDVSSPAQTVIGKTESDGYLKSSKATLSAPTSAGKITLKAEVLDQFGNPLSPAITRTRVFEAKVAPPSHDYKIEWDSSAPSTTLKRGDGSKTFTLRLKDGDTILSGDNYKLKWTRITSSGTGFTFSDSEFKTYITGDSLNASASDSATGTVVFSVQALMVSGSTETPIGTTKSVEFSVEGSPSTDTTVAITATSSSGTTNPTVIDNKETISFSAKVTTTGTTAVKSYRWVIYNDAGKSVYDSTTKSSTSKEFSLSKVGKSTLKSAGTFKTEITITDSNNKTCTDTYTFTIDEPSVEITKLTLNNTYVTVGESALVSASFTLSEKVDSVEDIEDSFEVEYDGKYIDSDDDIHVVLASGKKSGTVSFGVKGKSVGTDSVTFSSDLYEKDEITKPIYVVAGPAITQDYKADNHTIKFTLPTYVGTYMSPNMGVTGYRLLIYQGDTVKKTLDRVTTGSKEVSINVEELLSSIDLTGDSYTFKIGVEPVGKCNYGTSDVSDAQKSTSTTSKPDPLVAKTTDITAYKVAITAGADVTVSPSTVWGLPGQEVKLTASTSKAGADSSNIAWTKSGSNSALQRGSTYSYKVSTTTGDNKLTAQLAANSNSSSSGGGATPGTNSGSGANSEGLDDVPKTAESNAPIWLIIVLVFAAMGGAYALYMQMRPATVDNAPSEFDKNDDDYDDNF